MVRISRVLIAVAAAGLLVSGCTVKKTEQPPLTGPSELALSINLTANPDVVTQDGSSQSRIVILARDQNGVAVKGVQLHAGISVNKAVMNAGELSAADVTTGSDGRATLTYTSPPLPPDSSDQGIVITVSVVPTGTDSSNAVTRSVNIRLVPPAVVSPGPVAAFTFSPAAPIVNSPITFDASASWSSGRIIAYAWDFADNTTGSGVAPQHTYRGAGNYPVSLIILDDSGRTSYVSTHTVSVGEASAPTADFTSSPAAPIPLQTIFFDASASTAGTSRTITDYAWSFGNGSTSRGLTTTTSYSTVGTYTVTLIVTDDVGQKASKSGTVTVTVNNPTADFAANQVNDVGAKPVIIYLDPSPSKASSGQTITSYDWVFGDGTFQRTTTATPPVQWRCANPGMDNSVTPPKPKTTTYTITLTVTDSGGGRSTTAKTIVVTGF